MSIQIIGSTGTIANVNGSYFKALCVTSRPVEYGALGLYRISMISGAMTGTYNNEEIFQARWTDCSRLALVWGLSIDGFGTGSPGPGTGFANMNLVIARNWTVDGSGGLSADLSGTSQDLRTSMRPSRMNSIRIGTTNNLVEGTKTLDALSIGQLCFSMRNQSNDIFLPGIKDLYAFLEHTKNPSPVVLTENEGLVCRMTMPGVIGSLTFQFGVTMSWSEVVYY